MQFNSMETTMEAEAARDLVVTELEKLSEDDDESQTSTAFLENQLDHLQILLAQAETDLGGKSLAHPRSDDLTELNSILDGVGSSTATGENILHLTTPENILDVLGLSQEYKPKEKPVVPDTPKAEPVVTPAVVSEECTPLAEDVNEPVPSPEEQITEPEAEPATRSPSELEDEPKEKVTSEAAAEEEQPEAAEADKSPWNDGPELEDEPKEEVTSETTVEEAEPVVEEEAPAVEEPADEEAVVLQDQVDVQESKTDPVQNIKPTEEDTTEQETPVEGDEAEAEPTVVDYAGESVEEEKKEEECIAVLVLPEQGSELEERRESDMVEIVLPDQGIPSGSEDRDQEESDSVEVVLPDNDTQSQEKDNESADEATPLPTSNANTTSLPLEFEERDIVTSTSDTIMFQSGKLLTDLKHEVRKLRADYKKVEDNNKRLSQANSSAGTSFESLMQHAEQLQKKLEEAEDEVTESTTALADSRTLVAELRDEMAMKQATYVAEVQSRLRYQKALQEVTDLVQNNCTDSALVEQILSLADKVDEEAMAVPEMKLTTEDTNSVAESAAGATEDTPTVDNKTKKTMEQACYMSYIKACVWTT